MVIDLHWAKKMFASSFLHFEIDGVLLSGFIFDFLGAVVLDAAFFSDFCDV